MIERWLDTLPDTIPPLDASARAAARAHLERLTKPPGSLGRLETLVEQLAGITGSASPRIERPAVVVFAADHGVTAQGVSAYPSTVTAQMVANFEAGGAAINVLARAAGAKLVVIDVGVAGPEPALSSKIRPGTRDMTIEPAMTGDEALAAIGVGRDVVRRLIGDGCDAMALGEMGIGNTTAASALVAALTGRRPAEVTGRGTGLDDAAVRHKVAVIETALQRHQPRPDDPLGALVTVGGLEIAALVGAMLAAAEDRVPVVLDGFITGAAALVAVAVAPNLAPRLIASHRSASQATASSSSGSPSNPCSISICGWGKGVEPRSPCRSSARRRSSSLTWRRSTRPAYRGRGPTSADRRRQP